MEKWEDGFYITAMAGSASGSSLVVMSKGTPYTQQSYKVCSLPALLLCDSHQRRIALVQHTCPASAHSLAQESPSSRSSGCLAPCSAASPRCFCCPPMSTFLLPCRHCARMNSNLHPLRQVAQAERAGRCLTASPSSGSTRSGRRASTLPAWPRAARAGRSSCRAMLASSTSAWSWTSSTHPRASTAAGTRAQVRFPQPRLASRLSSPFFAQAIGRAFSSSYGRMYGLASSRLHHPDVCMHAHRMSSAVQSLRRT